MMSTRPAAAPMAASPQSNPLGRKTLMSSGGGGLAVRPSRAASWWATRTPWAWIAPTAGFAASRD